MTLDPIPVTAGPPVAVPVAGAPEGPFEVNLPVFSGPLALLLHLIESRQLDILSVPLADLADAYVAHLAEQPVDATGLSEFVTVAAQLILLKSRRLLPGEPAPTAADAADEPDEGELRQRLIEYRALRDLARALGSADLVAPTYRREPRESDLPEAPGELLSIRLLTNALAELARIPEPEAPPPEIMAREVTIAMQIGALQAALSVSGRVILQSVLAACRSRTEATVTLLAALELVRRRVVRAEQDELFGPIRLERVR
jgi:segregation and condensation protein A